MCIGVCFLVCVCTLELEPQVAVHCPHRDGVWSSEKQCTLSMQLPVYRSNPVGNHVVEGENDLYTLSSDIYSLW